MTASSTPSLNTTPIEPATRQAKPNEQGVPGPVGQSTGQPVAANGDIMTHASDASPLGGGKQKSTGKGTGSDSHTE
jgi:hypothetical protein